jgi:transcription elongation factor GreA
LPPPYERSTARESADVNIERSARTAGKRLAVPVRSDESLKRIETGEMYGLLAIAAPPPIGLGAPARQSYWLEPIVQSRAGGDAGTDDLHVKRHRFGRRGGIKVSAILLTHEGVRKMQAELARLEAMRHGVIERMRRAWEHGGISPENRDYADVLQERDVLDQQIYVVRRRLDLGELAEAENDGEVDIGERVALRNTLTGDVREYRIVGTGEGDPVNGDISHESPVGSALLGRRVGDVVEVAVPRGFLRLEVLNVFG